MSFDAGSIESTLTLDRTPFQRGLDQARADAERFTRNAIQARVDVDTAGAGARMADWRRLQERSSVAIGLNVDTIGAGTRMADWRRLQEATAVHVKVEADPDLGSSTRAGAEVGRTSSAAANEATRRGMSGHGQLIAAAILSAAPFVGAAVEATVGAGFIAAAAVVQRSNEQVRASFVQLGHDVVNELRNASDQTVPYLTQAGRALDAEFQALGPSISAAMSTAGPAVAVLTAGITQMASNAMPGLLASMQNIMPVMTGAANAMATLGAAGGQSLTTLSQHSTAFGTDLQSLGSIAGSVLGAITSLAANLGEAWASAAGTADQAIAGLASVVGQLAAGALPVLTAGLHVAADVLNGLTTIIGPFAPLLGAVATAAAAMWAAMKVGTAVAAGVKALATGINLLGANMVIGSARAAGMIATLQGVTVESSAAAVAVEAAGISAGSAAVGFGALVAASGPILALLGLAAAAVGLFATHTDDASKSTDQLTQDAALLAANVGTVGAHMLQSAQYQQSAADTAQMLGLSLADVTQGYQDIINSGSLASISVQAVAEAMAKASLAVHQAQQAITDHFTQVDQAVAQAQRSVVDAQHSYEQAVRGIADAQHSEAQAAQQVIQAEQGVAQAQHGVAQAQQQLQDAYQGVTSAELAYARSQRQEYDAQVALNTAREQAIRDLRDLHLQLEDQVTSEYSSHVQLFDAQQQAAALGVDSGNARAIASQTVTAANENQVKAAIALLQAENSLNDAMARGADLREQVATADRAGVEGSTVVLNAQRALQSAQDQVTSSAQALERAHRQVTDAEYALQNAQQNLVRAQQAVEQASYAEQRAHQSVTDAQYQQQHAALGLQNANQQLTLATDAASRSMDVNTRAGQQNLSQFYALMDAINKDGMPTQVQWREKIDDVAAAFGWSRDQAAEFLKKTGEIPPDFNYKVTATAEVNLASYNALINSLPWRPGTPVNITSLSQLMGLGHAEGGYISGPGGPTSDMVPAMLSNGEYVVKASAVAQHRPVLEAINEGRYAEGGPAIPVKRFADGGDVVAGQVALGVAGAAYQTNAYALDIMSPYGFNPPPLLPKYVPPPPAAMPSYAAGGGVAQWAGVILQALAMLGQDPGWLGTVERRMNQESGGSPTVVNTWDSNWFAGTPSVGLMQVIGPTYRAYAGPFAGTGPWEYGVSVDPLANTYAGLNYAIHRYGSLAALNQPGGYDNGGPLMPGYTVSYNGTGKPENVRTSDQEDALVTRLDRIEQRLAGGAGVTVHQSFNGHQWSAEEAMAASSRHMTAALRELT